ncbi:MAG: DUF2252 domain-containing protein [Acidobacteriota bacterium]|nr:DUF2252 domain-containing protein [Acidobacteriota bacterium]
MIATQKERTQFGRSRREAVSRAAQADVRVKERRFDPVAVLRAAAEGRVRQLLPIKYARMKISPFAFFRGAVSIMAADLGRLPHSGLMVQLCGDAHVQNLGSFAAPDGALVFDLNDFDESIRGPWEWDVKRMAASIVLAGGESGHARTQCKDAAEMFAECYYQSIRKFANLPILQVARRQIHRQKRIRPIHAALRQSQRAQPADLLAKFTENHRGQQRVRDLRPGFWRVRGQKALEVLNSLAAYREILSPDRRHLFDLFRPVDVGFKVVGTGSVGLRDYVVLFEGNGPLDPMFLQIKQEMPSAYAQWLPDSVYPHQGRRAAEGQRAVQPISDLLLGWTSIGEHHYLVRQLNDHKGRIDLEKLRGGGLESLAHVAGELLARGHARSGDACEISGYCGAGTKMARALRDFAGQYADQTYADYATFLTAIKKGQVKAAETAV